MILSETTPPSYLIGINSPSTWNETMTLTLDIHFCTCSDLTSYI